MCVDPAGCGRAENSTGVPLGVVEVRLDSARPGRPKAKTSMKLATLRDGTRDGALVVVRPDGRAFAPAREVARTLQAALDSWETTAPRLRTLAEALASGSVRGEPLDIHRLAAPLPRAYEWVDGSAYLNHVRLVRKARGRGVAANARDRPLGVPGRLGGAAGSHRRPRAEGRRLGHGLRVRGLRRAGGCAAWHTASQAEPHIKLLMLCNDVSLRNLIPAELGKGFGFFQGKPATAFSPFALTPDELGGAWRQGRLHLPLKTWLNGHLVGDTDAGPEMHFGFLQLIEHIARTRAFTAGTILGSGTVSNADRARGVSCLAEQRVLETLDSGSPKTPFLKPGDVVEIDMLGPDGVTLFGRLHQRVVAG